MYIEYINVRILNVCILKHEILLKEIIQEIKQERQQYSIYVLENLFTHR